MKHSWDYNGMFTTYQMVQDFFHQPYLRQPQLRTYHAYHLRLHTDRFRTAGIQIQIIQGLLRCDSRWRKRQNELHVDVIDVITNHYHLLEFQGLSYVTFEELPSGKLSHNYGKTQCLMGTSTISMVIFNSLNNQRVIISGITVSGYILYESWFSLTKPTVSLLHRDGLRTYWLHRENFCSNESGSNPPEGGAGCVPPMCMHQLAEAGPGSGRWDFTRTRPGKLSRSGLERSAIFNG